MIPEDLLFLDRNSRLSCISPQPRRTPLVTLHMPSFYLTVKPFKLRRTSQSNYWGKIKIHRWVRKTIREAISFKDFENLMVNSQPKRTEFPIYLDWRYYQRTKLTQEGIICARSQVTTPVTSEYLLSLKYLHSKHFQEKFPSRWSRRSSQNPVQWCNNAFILQPFQKVGTNLHIVIENHDSQVNNTKIEGVE